MASPGKSGMSFPFGNSRHSGVPGINMDSLGGGNPMSSMSLPQTDNLQNGHDPRPLQNLQNPHDSRPMPPSVPIPDTNVFSSLGASNGPPPNGNGPPNNSSPANMAMLNAVMTQNYLFMMNAMGGQQALPPLGPSNGTKNPSNMANSGPHINVTLNDLAMPSTALKSIPSWQPNPFIPMAPTSVQQPMPLHPSLGGYGLGLSSNLTLGSSSTVASSSFNNSKKRATPPKHHRGSMRREPHRSQFESEEEYKVTWHKWREARNSNNLAVKKCRSKAKKRNPPVFKPSLTENKEDVLKDLHTLLDLISGYVLKTDDASKVAMIQALYHDAMDESGSVYDDDKDSSHELDGVNDQR